MNASHSRNHFQTPANIPYCVVRCRIMNATALLVSTQTLYLFEGRAKTKEKLLF